MASEKGSRNKISRDVVPEGFTLGLALVDAVPVLAFGAAMVVLSRLLSSVLFLVGALLCLYAGAAKVLWKIIVVLRKRNIWWMFMQMRIVMPVGFILMIAGLFINSGDVTGAAVLVAIVSFPSVIFFVLCFLGMCLMMVFAFRLDSSDAKSNWIEQITNGVAQICFLTGLLLL